MHTAHPDHAIAGIGAAPAPPVHVTKPRPLSAVAVAVAVGSIAGTFLGPVFIDDPATYAAGPEAVFAELGGQLPTQLGALALYATAAVLVVLGLGLSRFLVERAPAQANLGRAVGVLLQIAGATVTVGAIMKSVLASGLPGGVDADFYTQVDVAVTYTVASQFQYAAFAPVVAAMAVVAVLSLRHRVLPRYVGVPAALLALGWAGVTAVLNLPWSAGLVTPLFMLALALALFRAPNREVRA